MSLAQVMRVMGADVTSLISGPQSESDQSKLGRLEWPIRC